MTTDATWRRSKSSILCVSIFILYFFFVFLFCIFLLYFFFVFLLYLFDNGEI